MRIAQLHPRSFQRIANGSRREANLLANGSEGVIVRVELLRLFGEFRGQLLAGAQGDAATPEMAGDGVAVGAELARVRVGGVAQFVEFQRLLLLIRGQATGHAVVTGRYGPDLRQCPNFLIPWRIFIETN